MAHGSRVADGLRLFVAFDLPEAHREELRRRAAQVAKELPSARWVTAENLHLTLVFLGDTARDLVPRLVAALKPAFAAVGPLELSVGGGGTFPPARPARVAWVGIQGPPELLAVQRRAAVAVAEILERPPESKPFHAHVTLARPRRPWNRRSAGRFVDAFDGPIGEPFVVERGVLYASELTERGAIYSAVERFRLGAVV